MEYNFKREARRQYFRYFRIWFIIVTVLAVICTVLGVRKYLESRRDRTNFDAPAERVYDYADVLTDAEEERLRGYIAEKEKELMTVHDKVKELTGYDMFLFRPPYGDYDAKLIKVAQKCNYYPIQWDVDSLDWKDYGVDSIVKTVTENEHLGNGSIILCHNGAKYTAEALDTLITTLKAQGYQFVPLSELIYRENYHMDHEGRQIPDSKKS